MSKKKLTGDLRDKLIIGLTMDDATAALNLAMRVRKLEFVLAWDEDPFPRLFLQMPDVPAQQIMRLDPRKHCCYIQPPSNADLFHGFVDITERLAKLEARLRLTCDRPRNGPRRAKLQLFVAGATRIALTLMEVNKGKRIVDSSFQLPDGTTP